MKFIPENIEFHCHKDEIVEKHSFLDALPILKGGFISKNIFFLVLSLKKHEPNHCFSSFQPKVKSWETVIS